MDESTGVGILGLGTSLPNRIRENDFWSIYLDQWEKSRNRDLLSLEHSSTGKKNAISPEIAQAMAALGGDPFVGARRRHVIDEDAEVSDIETEAAQRALRNASVRPDEIDLVIVHSANPDKIVPSNAPAVQANCQLVNAAAWSLDVSCASFQPQLIAATALVRSGTYRKILLVWSQAISRILDYTLPGSVAFGDGAAAAVIGQMPAGYGLLGHWTRTDGTLRDGVVFAPIVDGKPYRRWEKVSGPVKFTTFDVDTGKRAGLLVTELCREACLGALASAGLTIDDISLYIGNQSMGWLVDSCRRILSLPPEKAIDTFAEVGNIGSVAIPFNLLRAHQLGRLRDGDAVLMYSPGAGLTRAAVVYRWLAPHNPL